MSRLAQKWAHPMQAARRCWQGKTPLAGEELQLHQVQEEAAHSHPQFRRIIFFSTRGRGRNSHETSMTQKGQVSILSAASEAAI